MSYENESHLNNFELVRPLACPPSLPGVCQMLLEILGHAETLDLLSTEDGGHGLVGSEPLLVLRVLQLVLLQIGPQTLGALRARNLLSLLSAEDLGEVVGDVEFFLNKRNVR